MILLYGVLGFHQDVQINKYINYYDIANNKKNVELSH